MTDSPSPSTFRTLLRRGIRLPPAGWVLAEMLAFYVLAGLFGRDPWKGEDAIHIGVAWHMLTQGDWLSPALAGRPFHEPPLYYWSAALTGKALGWLLPLHEAIRMASGAWMALALTGLYYAGRELFGKDSAAASPLLLAGCAGLLFHAHDAQPMLVALAAYCAAPGALAASWRKSRLAGVIYGVAVAGCFLGVGIAPTLPLLAIAPLGWWLSADRAATARALALGAGVAIVLALPWPLLLRALEPLRFHGWLAAELAPLKTPFSFDGMNRFLAVLPWFAFPVLPLAAWTGWRHRNDWRQPSLLLPLAFLGLVLLMLAWAYRPREIPALLMLPPLALLATPGVLTLRRGTANGFDWFAMSGFTFFAAVTWVAWSAMALGWPERLAQRAVALRPGFSGQFDLSDFLTGVLATLWWLWLILTAPRSPYRSLAHWTMGCTTLWLLATSLILPWFDYGKSYRPVAQAIARQLPASGTCLAERDLTATQRASFAYFTGLQPADLKSAGGRRCDWLVVVGRTARELAAPGEEWIKVWEGFRPGDRKEKFYLYRR